MRELYLEWLPVLGSLLGGTVLLTGFLLGVCDSLKHIFGYSNNALCGDSKGNSGIIPLSVLRIGVLSVIGGVLWLYFFQDGSHIMYGITAGGFLGLLYLGFVRKLNWFSAEGDTGNGIMRKIGGVQGIAPVLGGIAVVVLYILIGGTVGGFVGGMIGLVGGFVISRPGTSVLNMIASGLMAGGTIGGIVGGIRGMKAGIEVGGRAVGEFVDWFTVGGIGGGIAGGVVNGMYGITPGAVIGASVGGIGSGIPLIVLPFVWILASMVSLVLAPLLILSRFKRILCNNCLRYTRPLKSKYKDGKRYCERCRKEVEFTTDPGEVILNFGNLPLELEGRVFMLTNPDFEQKTKYIDVSEVYIDTKTCDKFLLEKFITYILNYPPEGGLQSVQIFYRGELDELGENLKNALRNTFKFVEKIH
jgi:hypothetical protein